MVHQRTQTCSSLGHYIPHALLAYCLILLGLLLFDTSTMYCSLPLSFTYILTSNLRGTSTSPLSSTEFTSLPPEHLYVPSALHHRPHDYCAIWAIQYPCGTFFTGSLGTTNPLELNSKKASPLIMPYHQYQQRQWRRSIAAIFLNYSKTILHSCSSCRNLGMVTPTHTSKCEISRTHSLGSSVFLCFTLDPESICLHLSENMEERRGCRMTACSASREQKGQLSVGLKSIPP